MQPDGTYRLDRPDGSWLAFSDRGELVRATDRLGNATAYEYSAPTNTLLADARRLDAVTDAAGQRIELAYAGDRVQSATMRIAAGAALRRVTFAFDGGALARADVQRPQPNGSFATIETTRYEYNADGQMSGLIGPDGVRRLANSSDWRGRSTERQDASGNRVGFQFSTDPTTGVRTTTATDAGATGRNDPLAHGTDALRFLAPGSASTTLTDAAGRVLSSTTADGFSTTFGYTGGLAPTSITLPTLGRAPIQVTRNAADLPTRITDPANVGGRAVEIEYNPANRPTRITDRLGRVTTYTYTDWNDVATVTEAAGTPLQRTTTFVYNAQKLLQRVTRQVGSAAVTLLEHGYDGFGQVTATTDPSGLTTALAYDDHGRVARVYDPRLTVRTTTSSSSTTTSARPCERSARPARRPASTTRSRSG